MQNKKYRIDYTQKIEEFGRTLYRIVALADFGIVTTGDQGGYIESEKNLSQSGNAWEWWTQWKPILFEILKVENKVKT